jgi:hypothetical protein
MEPHMFTIADVLVRLPAEIKDKYDFSNAVYKGASTPIKGIVCPKHGEFAQYTSALRKSMACQGCGAERRAVAKLTPAQDYFAKVSEIHGGKYDYSGTTFIRMNAPIEVRCPTHGVFLISANHHYYRKQGCGKCETEAKRTRIVKYRHLSAQSKINNTAKDFFERCAGTHEGKYTYPPQEYRGAKYRIRVVCPTHGEFEQVAWEHLSGSGCASCGAIDPKWERDVAEYLQSLGFVVERNVPVLNKKHIDIYIPDRKFGVELHGLNWHTVATRGTEYHRNKWEIAESLGIQLVQVFEDEWADKPDIVRRRLAAMLGVGQKLDARKCELVVLESSEGRGFLDSHHLQGAGIAALYYGLKHDGQLVAVASFGKSRTGAMTGAMVEGEWEVVRYASIGRVRGGFGRLFSAFLKDVSPLQVISYCDLRYGNGSVYAATGFKLRDITPPDYWWVPNGKVVRISRYATQKHKIPKHPVLSKFYAPGKTEAQVCADAGWEKIYGVGHQKWLWLASPQ